jgi:hypothetical protein
MMPTRSSAVLGLTERTLTDIKVCHGTLQMPYSNALLQS